MRNQRERLAAGIIAAVACYGYNDATITRIAEAAGLSRRTFYEYFNSKQECFLQTFDLIVAHLLEEATTAAAEHSAWTDRVRAAFLAALETFAANPDLARFVLIAPSTAGEEIVIRYRTLMQRTLVLITERKPEPPATREPSPTTEQALIGGIASLVVHKVKAGEGERLPELLPDLLELFFTPYLGRSEAVRVARAGF
jgi:AcrR family transcriptional regulator